MDIEGDPLLLEEALLPRHDDREHPVEVRLVVAVRDGRQFLRHRRTRHLARLAARTFSSGWFSTRFSYWTLASSRLCLLIQVLSELNDSFGYSVSSPQVVIGMVGAILSMSLLILVFHSSGKPRKVSLKVLT